MHTAEFQFYLIIKSSVDDGEPVLHSGARSVVENVEKLISSMLGVLSAYDVYFLGGDGMLADRAIVIFVLVPLTNL